MPNLIQRLLVVRPSIGSWHDRWLPEAILVLAVASAAVFLAPLNTDSGWYMVGARRLFDGDRLYVDLVDVNPPLIFWVMAVPAFLGHILRLPDERAVGLFAGLLLVFSVLVSIRLLSLAPRLPRLLRSGQVCAFLVALTTAGIWQVGQREQMSAGLLLPYVLLAARRIDGAQVPVALSSLVGALAGVGVALKPFFLAPWLALELFVLLSRRRLPSRERLEFWLVLLVQGAYALVVLIVTPEYLTRVVPLARETYGAYGASRLEFIQAARFWVVGLCGCVALLAYVAFDRRSHQSTGAAAGAATLGFLVSYVAQGKGWHYHLIPAFAFAAMSVVGASYAVGTALLRLRHRSWKAVVAVSAFAVAILLLGARIVLSVFDLPLLAVEVLRTRYHPGVVPLAEVASEVAPGEPIFVMSTSTWPAFPVVNLAGATWPYHYNCLWPLPGFYPGAPGSVTRYRVPEAQGPAERAFFQTVVDDLVRVPPRLLVVDRSRDKQALEGREFDFMIYFNGSADFRALFRRYRRLGNIGPWEIYERLR